MKRAKCRICGKMTSGAKMSKTDIERGLTEAEVTQMRLTDHCLFEHTPEYVKTQDALEVVDYHCGE